MEQTAPFLMPRWLFHVWSKLAPIIIIIMILLLIMGIYMKYLSDSLLIPTLSLSFLFLILTPNRIYGTLANNALARQKYEIALSYINELITLNSRKADYYAYRSSIFYQLMRYEEGIKDNQRAVELTSNRKLLSQIYGNNSIVWFRLRRFERHLMMLIKH